MAGEHLLVVEDDVALLQGLQDILELAGYRVTTAGNGLEALAALDQVRPQLIVSDIMMPRMDGFRFFEAVRARPDSLEIPFIFLTARGEKSDIRRGKQLGVDDYVTKPFDEEDLLVAVRSKLQRRAELAAWQSREISDLKRTILTTLNHEFRTPLTYISTYTELLRDARPEVSPEEFKDILHGIQVGSDRLRRLVEDFMLLVELQTGEAREAYLRRRQLLAGLSDLLANVVRRHAAAAETRRVTLNTEIASGLPPVMADSEYLLGAVNRLLENAIKFSKKDGGRVTLRAQAAGEVLRISVTDEGIGIQTEARDKLFDVFYQIDRAKLEQQGSGSGLAIARGIARLHGGDLRVESESGAGSTFTLEIPLSNL